MIEVLDREAWGAEPPKRVLSMHPTRREGIVGHWPAMPSRLSDIQMLQSAQRFHMHTKRWDDIAYSIALGRDGTLYWLRGPNVRGGHTAGENDDRYAVLFLLGTDESPTPEMLAGFPLAIEALKAKDPLLGDSPTVVGHRHVSTRGTQCPGEELAAFLWAYNHQRDYLDKLNKENNVTRSLVTGFYRNVLDREPDAEGFDYWVSQLESDTLSEAQVLSEFLKVRLSADKAALNALSARTNGPTEVDFEEVVDRVYGRFVKDISALAKGDS